MNPVFKSYPLVAALCRNPRKMLALLLLLAVCLRVTQGVRSLADLVDHMTDSLLADIQPEHVLEYIHTQLPRRDGRTNSFVLFGFDEVPAASAPLVLSPQPSGEMLAVPML